MIIKFRKQFLKDLHVIPHEYRNKIEHMVFTIIPNETNEQVLKLMSKMKGYEGYYKIRIGFYRIGVHIEGDNLEFQRALHRKEIYRFFP